MGDIVILTLSVGLGLPKRIGVRNFVPVYLGVKNVLPILLALFLHADRLHEFKEYAHVMDYRHSISNVERFDFVIVGGGAAGCVVANRLSRHHKVLLIERGGNPNPLTYVPGLDTLLASREETDYTFFTTPQNSSCFSCNQRRSIWSQGKGLGGSGMLSSNIYLRGHPFDYDHWAYHTRDKRWKYNNVLKYFLKSEDYCFKCEKRSHFKSPTDEHYHSTDGYLPLMKAYHAPLQKTFLKAMSWANIEVQDQNAPYYYTSANVAVYNHYKSRRSSAYSSFIAPILDRKNLKIWKYTQAIQVLLDQTNRAYAVKYERFGKIGLVKASKEIIISSGAINTPKILLQSGIGPKHHLHHHKIPVRIDLPVGYNLQDTVGTFVGPILIKKPLSYIYERDNNYFTAVQFVTNGTGPLALPFPAGNAFWASSRAVEEEGGGWPDVQVGFAPHGVSEGFAETICRSSNINEEVLNEWLAPVVGHDAFWFQINSARPKSRGRVKLRSTNWNDDPIINPRYYEDKYDDDIKVIVEALTETCWIAENAPPFKKLGARLYSVPFPHCADILFKSAKYWECVARHLTVTFHNYVGTASMGRKSSKLAVVDSELKVIGARRLRVIDSSVIPFLTVGNVHAPTIMVGERGADLILDKWGRKKEKKKGWSSESESEEDVLVVEGTKLKEIKPKSTEVPVIINPVKRSMASRRFGDPLKMDRPFRWAGSK